MVTGQPVLNQSIYIVDLRRDRLPISVSTALLRDERGKVERSYIFDTLNRNQRNRTATAAEMGIHPTTLWRKMKRFKIEPPEKACPLMV
jgi:transcriptional regulator with PAS, ATPase and Fis domain